MDYIDLLILRAHGSHSNVPFEETIKGMKVRGARLCMWLRACTGACARVWLAGKEGVLANRKV